MLDSYKTMKTYSFVIWYNYIVIAMCVATATVLSVKSTCIIIHRLGFSLHRGKGHTSILINYLAS